MNCDNSEQEQNKEESVKVVFKKRKCIGNRRNANIHSDDDLDESKRKIGEKTSDQDDSIDWSTLDELRELQKAKKRVTKGINVVDLLTDNKKQSSEKKTEKAIGGLTDSKTLASELDLGNTFSIETNRRDEDAELMKYVDEELAKRRSNSTKEDSKLSNSSTNKLNATDDLLIKIIPENLLKLINETKTKNEEMLSSQMLSGIPEVNLGIEERIRNIEKTEAARTKLIEEKLKQEHDKNKDTDPSFAPKNLASCFTRNNYIQSGTSNTNHRFNLNSIPNENKDLIAHFKKDDKNVNNYKLQPVQNYDIEPVVVIGDEPQKIRLLKPIDKDKRVPGKDKPSDDYIFEKFRKQLKKH